jgi:hypothetical protein
MEAPMRRYFITMFFAISLSFPFSPAMAHAGTDKNATCYIIIEEGASSDASELFIKKMGIEPDLLNRVAPTHFEMRSTDFLYKATGSLSYEAEQPHLVLRSGRYTLYSVSVKYRAGPYPKAKTIKVSFPFADLIAGGDLVQPADKAIALAARSTRMKSGEAWIIDMSASDSGAFHATVALAP